MDCGESKRLRGNDGKKMYCGIANRRWKNSLGGTRGIRLVAFDNMDSTDNEQPRLHNFLIVFDGIIMCKIFWTFLCIEVGYKGGI